MQNEQRVLRTIAGFAGLALLACQPAGPDAVETIDPAGFRVFAPAERLAVFPPDPLDPEVERPIEGAFGLAVGDSGFFVVDQIAGHVLAFDLDGRFRAQIGRRGDGPGELGSVTSIAVGGSGAVSVADPTNGRISTFDSDGSLLGEIGTPFPVVSHARPGDGAVIVPSLDGARLVTRLDPSGASHELDIDPSMVPTGLRGGLRSRLGFGALHIAMLEPETLLLTQYNDAERLGVWTARLDPHGQRVTSVSPLPLPVWLLAMLREQLAEFRKMEFEVETAYMAFLSVRVVDGEIWITPNAGGALIAATLPRAPTDSVTVIVPAGEEADGMGDAAVVGDRLILLGRTSVALYRLERVDVERFPYAASDR
ncbi:MAG: 6-bladed beta-propeller [Gemmatimonadetes bacterium]|nr:6-bladed beta-propeller [Gemmatimonadota bacterium]